MTINARSIEFDLKAFQYNLNVWMQIMQRGMLATEAQNESTLGRNNNKWMPLTTFEWNSETDFS